MSRSAEAIKVLKETGSIADAMDIVIGRTKVTEARNSQTWFLPNQDALQQAILRIMDMLPAISYTVKDTDNGAQGGYAITVSGDFDDGDVASLLAVKGATKIS